MVRLRLAGGGLNLDIQARLNEAAQAHARGDLGAAAKLYRQIVSLSPHEPDALHMLGVIAQQTGKTELALHMMDMALAARPGFSQAWYNRSVILHALRRDDEALASARMALELEPNFANVWDIAGQILKDKGNYAEAGEFFSRAIALQPDNPAFHANFSLWMFAQGDLASAYRLALKAEQLNPAFPPMLLGNFLKALGYPARAAERYARARALRPDYADVIASEAMTRLQIGEWAPGWALWEQRPDLKTEYAAIPFWQGNKVDSLLLYEDQGLGDALQFVRYIPMLKERAGRITLLVHESLQRLLAMNFPDLEVLTTLAESPNMRCRLSSLPYHFGTRLENIPPAPYLTAPTPLGAYWRGVLKTVKSPRIGLVWAGNAKFRSDADRSIKFAEMRKMLDKLGRPAHFVALQKERPDDASEVSATGVFDAAPLLQDFADTAALIAQLDLVITVDTAVAHLAGALGKPVFILLPFSSDWRWMLGREDSPWYGSARLFRLGWTESWSNVFETIAEQVEKLFAGDPSALAPKAWCGEVLRQAPDAITLPA